MTDGQISTGRHPDAGDGRTALSDHDGADPALTVPGGQAGRAPSPAAPFKALLYTPEQKRRRDNTKWTLVQGLLAPLQFLAMGVSVVLVVRYLQNGEGLLAANISVVVKTMFLYVIMITGAIWEKVVFGQYLFHEKFFWEDVVSMGVIALHTVYLWGLFAQWEPRVNLTIALAGYAAYTVNAIQFLAKLRAARLADAAMRADAAILAAAAGEAA